MRATKRLRLIVFAGIVCFGMPVHGQENSTVIPEHASIHSQPSPKASVTGSLDHGDPVVIELMVSDSGGSWCLIRERRGRSPAGYVLCTELTHEVSQIQSPARAVTRPSQRVTVLGSKRDDSRNAVSTKSIEPDALGEWATQFGFTEDQSRRIAQALETSGLAACRGDLADTLRHYGVTDAYSLLVRTGQYARNPFGDSFAAIIEPKIKRCGARYKSFWQAFWNTLTPEQREKAAHTTFLLDYLGSQSDPDTALIFSVLQYMRRTGSTK